MSSNEPNLKSQLETAKVAFDMPSTNVYRVNSALKGTDELKIIGETLELSGSNTFTGGITILNGGTLNANNNFSLGTGILSLSGGTLQQTMGGSITLPNSFTVVANSTIGGASNLTLSGRGNLSRLLTIKNTAVTTLAGVIGGYDSIILKAVGGNLILLSANTYAGGTTITAGTLIVGNANALGYGILTLNGGNICSNATFTISNNFVLTAPSSIGGANNFSFIGAGHISQDLTVNNTAGTINLLGPLSGRGNLIKENFGTLILAGMNIYAGSILISSGTLSIPKDCLEGYSGTLVIRNAGTFIVTNASNNNIFTVEGPIEISFEALRNALSTESEKSLASRSKKDSHELLARYAARDEKRNLEITYARDTHHAAGAAAARGSHSPRHEDTAAGAAEKDKRDRERKSHGR